MNLKFQADMDELTIHFNVYDHIEILKDKLVVAKFTGSCDLHDKRYKLLHWVIDESMINQRLVTKLFMYLHAHENFEEFIIDNTHEINLVELIRSARYAVFKVYHDEIIESNFLKNHSDNTDFMKRVKNSERIIFQNNSTDRGWIHNPDRYKTDDFWNNYDFRVRYEYSDDCNKEIW